MLGAIHIKSLHVLISAAPGFADIRRKYLLNVSGYMPVRAGVRRVQTRRGSDPAAGGHVGDVEGEHLCRNSLLFLRRLLDGLVPLWDPEVGAPCHSSVLTES